MRCSLYRFQLNKLKKLCQELFPINNLAIRSQVVKIKKLEKSSETIAHSQFPIPHSQKAARLWKKIK
jgi:hypothetical protein